MNRLLALPIILALTGCASIAQLPVISDALTPDVSRSTEALRSGNYQLDQAHAHLDFSVVHMGLSDLTGQISGFEASLSFDEADPAAASLDVILDMTTLYLSSDSFSETLKGESWFDTAQYPVARFTSTQVDITGETTGRVTGTLDLHGKSAPVTLDVTFNGGAKIPITGKYTIGFNAQGSFNRSDFGLGKYSPMVSDAVTLAFSGEFEKTE